MISEPNQRCEECGRIVIVRPDGRGFPPDIAKQQLRKQCKKAGHVSRPIYTAGFNTWFRDQQR